MDLANPSECAVRAALEMRSNLAELNSRWKVLGLTQFENGIGIHTGDVVQRTIGSRDRIARDGRN